MKVRKRDLCGTCRKRKLQCDGKRPACTQCLFSKRKCEGYPDALFLPFIAIKPAGKAKALRTRSIPQSTETFLASAENYVNAKSAPNEVQNSPTHRHEATKKPTGLQYLYQPYSESLSTLQEKVNVILSNFIPLHELNYENTNLRERSSRFCGSWAMALPELSADIPDPFSQCLHSAVSALALSITAYRARKNLLDEISAQYEHSLRLLGHSLDESGNTYRSKLVAAVMCLALVEVLSPTQPFSWLVHVEGVSKMVQLLSPGIFASGVEHTIFIGFRPLLILKAFILRKATFFADDLWATLPFQCHQAAPLQDLLGVAARVPGVLEKVDDVLADPSDATRVAEQLIEELIQSIAQLQAWHASFLNSTSATLYWQHTVERHLGNRFESLWYQDLNTANVFIYFWAFHLICLTEMRNLLDRFPQLEHCVRYGASYGRFALRDESLELSARIYQSMEYVLQEDFMLYGVSSAGFPLQIACKTLQSDAKGAAILSSLDPSIIHRSKMRGP